MLKLPFRTFRFELKTEQPFYLPAYAGSMMRGGFGRSFRRISCAFGRKPCEECMLRSRCFYHRIFETTTDKPGRPFQTTHPYIIRPIQKLGGKEEAEVLSLEVTLMDDALDALPHFVYAFIEFGRFGMGKERAQFELDRVVSKGDILYQNGDSNIELPAEPMILDSFMEPVPDSVQQVQLRFLTPVRAKIRQRYRSKLSFQDIVRLSTRRVRVLSRALEREDPFTEKTNKLMEQALDVRTVSSNCRWFDWRRYSSRQQQAMHLGGVVGEMSFAGDLTPYVPLLKAGEILHIGKNTSFGLGKVEVEIG